ncbi:MAG: hypothetical protein IPG09_10505 [Ignavibacteria bacterium]|nr:hypothetical protein [Ignavibacteria bacterium]
MNSKAYSERVIFQAEFSKIKNREVFQNFGHILLKKGSSGVSLIETADRTVTKCSFEN